jgi:3-deoxy-7-phosphoheptulonate synthase
MIIAIKPGTAKEDIRLFIALLEKQGGKVHYSEGASQTVLGLVGDTTGINEETLSAHHLVEKIIRVQEPYKRANRAFHPQDTRIDVPVAEGAVRSIGGGQLGIIAGPCSVENREQIVTVARSVKQSGAAFLRGGPLNPGPAPTVSRAWVMKGWTCSWRRKRKRGSPL